MNADQRAVIQRYLETGDEARDDTPWPGNFLERERAKHDALINGLVNAVRRRRPRRRQPVPEGLDPIAFTRSKVEPMVRGLFPRTEQDLVIATLERSTIFLTTASIEEILRSQSWLSTAWTLANVYLASVAANTLGPDAPNIVGLSEHTTFYVSTEYFEDEDPFSDYVVHEAAHVFHNCKRRTLGLPFTRRREWLLDIEFRKRETFAYACEAFSRVVEKAPALRDRESVAATYAKRAPHIGDARVDSSEVADIVGAAAASRRGWKVILERCSPARAVRRRSTAETP